jgi:hypothetical protein
MAQEGADVADAIGDRALAAFILPLSFNEGSEVIAANVFQVCRLDRIPEQGKR